MARPIRVSILADPKDFVAGLKQAETAAQNIDATLSGTERMFASLDNTMSKVSGSADFISGEFGRIGAGITGVGDRLAEMNPEWAGLGGALSEVGKNFTLVSDAADVAVGVMNTAQGAMGLLKDATILQDIATKAAAAGQWLLNAAMSANPIMIVVLAVAALVAGLVWFFTQTEIGRTAWANFTAFLTSAWEGFTAFMGDAWAKITGAFDAGVKAVDRFLKDADRTIRDIWGSILGFFNGIPGKIGAVFAAAGTWLLNAGGGIMNGLKSGAEGAWSTVSGWIGGLQSKITGVFSGAINWLSSAGGNLLMGLWNGINDKVGWVTAKVAGIGTSIINAVKRTFGIASPSKVFAGIGGHVMDGLEKGLRQIDGVRSAMAAASDAVTGSFDAELAVAGGAGGGNYYSFDGLTFQTANDEEARILAEFVAFARRKARAGGR